MTAARLAGVGCDLALCGRDEQRLGEVFQSMSPRPGRTVFTQAFDLLEGNALEDFVETAADRLGGLDGLVVNAGGSFGRGLAASSHAEWERTWALNIGQAERAVRAALPALGRSGRGSVVLISSISGWKPAPGAQYGSAKAGQIYLAASLARELGTQGIRVNALAPGSTRVPGRRWDRMRTEDPDAFARFMTEFPGGALVEMDEIADVAAFLLSDLARGISGALIPVDKAQNAPGAGGY